MLHEGNKRKGRNEKKNNFGLKSTISIDAYLLNSGISAS